MSEEHIKKKDASTETTTKPVNKKTLEEDDEFEDFPVDSWPANTIQNDGEEIQNSLWEENWDDVEVEDNFTNELKAELEKYKASHQN